MAKIRVAIVGVGNCASSLVQGVEFYRRAAGHSAIPGVMHLDLGGYHIGDIEFAAAFDVAIGKVGCDLAQAILAPPNNTERFSSVPATGVEVRRGPTYDGIGRYLNGVVVEFAGSARRRRENPSGDRRRNRRLLSAGRGRNRLAVVRRAGIGGGLRSCELHSGIHC